MSIKQGNNYIAAGGGTGAIDNLSITENSSNKLQTVGVINSRDTSTAIKTWTGTRQQYDAILSKDANTLYNITDDTDVSLTILEALYPVGSVYITTANTCPLSALISGSTWTLVSSGIVKSGEVPVKGTGMALGFTNGTTTAGGLQIYSDTGGNRNMIQERWYGASVRSTVDAGTNIGNGVYGITTDSSKSGMVLDTTSFTLSVNIYERTA
jgi:hypothetical protein